MIFLFLQCVSTVIIVDNHYKSTELVSLYTLDIGLKINIIIIIIYCYSYVGITVVSTDIRLPGGYKIYRVIK